MKNPLRQGLLEDWSFRRVTPPVCVLLIALTFSFWLLPIQYINPASVSWIFASRIENFIDGAGHAIQAMYFAQERWNWPVGKFTSFGGPAGASLILSAVSPLFALPAKLFESAGIIGPFWQFVGIQAVLGISLTAVAVYFLALSLGASKTSSGTAALLSIPLPNLYVLALFNETLSWQFLAIIPMILVLRDRQKGESFWPWPVILGIATWTNTYFAAMIFAFFLTHLWVIRRWHGAGSLELLRESAFMLFVAGVLHYFGGGFLIPLHNASTTNIDDLNLYSVDLADLFHSSYVRQGYVYRGYAVLALLAAWGIYRLYRRFKHVSMATVSAKNRTHAELPILIMAILLFFLALGPTIQFSGAHALKLPFPGSVLKLLGVFRALGRFSWPLIYLALGYAALALDQLTANLALSGKKHSIALLMFGAAVLALHLNEFYPQLKYFKQYGQSQMQNQFTLNAPTDEAIATQSDEIVFVPAYDQSHLGTDQGAPWNWMSYYGIKHHVPIYTYQWLGRYDDSAMLKIREEGIQAAVECRWSRSKTYVLRRDYLPRIGHCAYITQELAAFSNWIVLRLK